MEDNIILKVTIRTNMNRRGKDMESDRYKITINGRVYPSVSYASVERLRKRIRIGHLDSWLWR